MWVANFEILKLSEVIQKYQQQNNNCTGTSTSVEVYWKRIRVWCDHSSARTCKCHNKTSFVGFESISNIKLFWYDDINAWPTFIHLCICTRIQYVCKFDLFCSRFTTVLLLLLLPYLNNWRIQSVSIIYTFFFFIYFYCIVATLPISYSYREHVWYRILNGTEQCCNVKGYA